MKLFIMLFFFCPSFLFSQNIELQNLAIEFFNWRSIIQPATSDDILRVERPEDWKPDYSSEAISNYKKKYQNFSQRLNSISKNNWTRSDSVDFLLLRSAIERVNWELNVLKIPNRNPDFYVHQTVGSVFELLLIHSPITEERAKNIIIRFNSFPKTIESAKKNLNEGVPEFANIAIGSLKDIKPRLQKVSDELIKIFPSSLKDELTESIEKGITSLIDFKEWLEKEKPKMTASFVIGRENYIYFLKNIALIPYTPEELLRMGNTEWDRSVAFDIYEELKNKNIPEAKLFSSSDEQIKQSGKDEESIRKFLEEKNIMSVPDWVQHYTNKKLPEYLVPISNMGVTDDLTSEKRLNENAVSYIHEPSPDLSFFRLASAQDPRPIIVHEGIPGHYFQLANSWANENPIRRRFIDSGPIEGIGFYVEEMLLQFGLYDDRPHTREIIYKFMRLRALRVDVDVNLALGNFTIEEGGNYLASTVPMDEETGKGEAAFFAYNPVQAISYQIGKLQILKLIADAKILLGEKFVLKDYHDYMMKNGNVPIALQRWEYLGLKNEIDNLWPSD
ncbi:MAG: DUF885 family protein [Ignavibacteriaceae bacterium]